MRKIINGLKKYRRAGKKTQKGYLRKFEEKMMYRTTKTENPETTPKMVKEVLSKMKDA